jgi:hypothetical protein
VAPRGGRSTDTAVRLARAGRGFTHLAIVGPQHGESHGSDHRADDQAQDAEDPHSAKRNK